jgi:hypothetical protein
MTWSSETLDPRSTPMSINGVENPDLVTLKTPLAILDEIVQRAPEFGLNIILSRHQSSAGHQDPLWYNAEYSSDQFVADWKKLATRYAGNPTVIGCDLQNDLRGDFANPIIRVGEALSDLVHFDKHGLHFPFAIVLIVLTVVVFQRLPASYGLFSVAIVTTSLAAENLNSIERYGLNAFPLVIALAMLVPSRFAERVTVLICGAAMFGMCALAWLGTFVP